MAYALDRYVDPKFEKASEQVYLKFLNNQEQFYENVALLVSKQSYFNVQHLHSHKQLQGRFQLLLKVTKDVKSYGFSNPERLYPFEPVIKKIELDGLTHQNHDIRQTCQQILTAIYDNFGFAHLKNL